MDLKSESQSRRGSHLHAPPSTPTSGPLPTGPGGLGGGSLGGPAAPVVRSALAGGRSSGPECAGCQKPIRERFLLKALDQLWHEDCLKCACCDCRLGEVGSTLFTKANLILCKRDYLRLFGTTGLCSACNKTIPAFEMVMRARGNVYHLECFACQQCNHRFCVGDKFYLHDNKILCEYDYEERMVFASLPYTYNISHLKCPTGPVISASSGPQAPASGGGPPTVNNSSGNNNNNNSGSTNNSNANNNNNHLPDDGSSGYGSADSNFEGGK